MILNLLGWVCISILLCIFFHYTFTTLKSLYAQKKKFKYLGEFENRKYQELINECKKIDKKDNYPTQLDIELCDDMTNMKNSLIEFMNNETV